MTIQMEVGTSSSIDQENKIGIMGFEQQDDDDDSFSVSSDVSSVVNSSDDESDDDDDSFEQNKSSDLVQQLPSKRGLSKHFQGKSQSFTSLSNVTCLEDLAKPENPYNKKLKSCKSYVGLSRAFLPPTRSASSSTLFAKTTSSLRATSCSSSRPPSHQSHSSRGATNASGFSNQSPLFV